MSLGISREHNQVMLTGAGQDEMAADFSARVQEDLGLWVVEYPYASVAHARLSKLTTLAVVRGMGEVTGHEEIHALDDLEAKIEKLEIPHILLFNVDKTIEELRGLDLNEPGQTAS